MLVDLLAMHRPGAFYDTFHQVDWGHLKPLQILLTYIKTKVYEDLEYF